MRLLVSLFFSCSCLFGAQTAPKEATQPSYNFNQLKELIYDYQTAYGADWSHHSPQDYLCACFELIKQATEYFDRWVPDNIAKIIWQLLMYDKQKTIKLYIFCRHYQLMSCCRDQDIAKIIDGVANRTENIADIVIICAKSGLPLIKVSNDYKCNKPLDIYDQYDASNLVDDMNILFTFNGKRSGNII
jgi:hypothetical protein